MPSFAFDDLNIGALNRFVQCNIRMEDMRIAQAVHQSLSARDRSRDRAIVFPRRYVVSW